MIIGRGGNLRIEIKGADLLAKTLQNLPPKAKAAAKAELRDITLDLKGKSQELAPVDTGDLRGSAFAEVSEASGDISGAVGFTEPYATRQHEEVTYNHPKGGQAKYLEQPYKENLPKYIDGLGAAIKKAVGP